MHRTESRFERLMIHAALEGHELAVMHHNQMSLGIGARIKEYVEQRQKSGALLECDPSTVLFSVCGAAQFMRSRSICISWPKISFQTNK